MAESEDGWKVVSEDVPTKVSFDSIGDEFIGRFVRRDTVNGRNGTYYSYIFTDGSFNGEDGEDGERYAVSGTRIEAGMKTVRAGNFVRIRYIADIPTNSDNDMKEYQIAIRR